MKLKQIFQNDTTEDLTLKPGRLLQKNEEQEEFKEIFELYQSDNVYAKLTASLLNAAVTKNLPCFLISRSIMQKLVAGDENLKTRSTVSGQEYSFLMKILYDNKIIENVYKSSDFSNNKTSMAGLIKIIYSDYLKLFPNYNERYEYLHKIYVNARQKRERQYRGRK